MSLQGWLGRHSTAAVLTVGLLASCTPEPTAPTATSGAGAHGWALDVVSGDKQTAVVGTQLPPLIVKVTNNGNPVAGEALNFRIVAGGGSVFGGTEVTDPRGIAQELWTLGPNAGPQSVEARLVSATTGGAVVQASFTATATAGPAAVLKVSAGDQQTAVVGTAVAIRPAVLVADKYGNGIPGVAVTFAVARGGGSLTQASQTTGANGVATLGGWTLGTVADTNTLTATTAGALNLAGSPLKFTALAMRAGAMSLVSPTLAFSAPTGSVVAPVARVLDVDGNGIPNVAVTLTVTGGNGSLDGVGSLTTLTDSTGTAGVRWTLGPVPGTNTLQATAQGLRGSPLLFTATGTGCDCWTTAPALPTPVWGPAAAAVGSVLYVVGGNDNRSSLQSLVAFDPASGAGWFTKAQMPTARQQLAAGAIDGVLYAVGGSNGGTLATVEAYSAVTDAWSSLSPMPTARYALAAGVINGILYAVGGFNGRDLSTLEAFDPATNSWSARAPMPTPRSGLGVGIINGILYAVGGSSNGGYVATVEAYDPATNTWTTKASMSSPRGTLGVGVLNGILYAVGGTGVLGPDLMTLEAYDPGTDAWTTKTPMPTGRLPAAGAVNGRLYAVGGFTATGFTAAVEVYQP